MGMARGMRRGRRGRLWMASVAALVALAGCSDPAASDGAGSPASSTANASATSEASSSGSVASGASIAVGTTSLGDVLVDGAGMTLYMFDQDTNGGDSTCYDQCASAWPPLLTDGAPAAGAGADAAMLGTVARSDGTTQVTYGGWPLYYWAQDSAVGDVKGQAVNDVWWVLGADGQPIHG